MLKTTTKPFILQGGKQKLSKVKGFAQSHSVTNDILRTKLTVTNLSSTVHSCLHVYWYSLIKYIILARDFGENNDIQN